MKKERIKAIVLGCGNRGTAYCKAAEDVGDPYEIVAAVDFRDEALEFMQKRFGVPKDMCFKDYKEVLKFGKIADCVINTTMDNYHVETAVAFMEQGYDMLLEKPVANNKDDLLKVAEKARENGCKLVVCHVLRYTPFYKKAKALIEEGAIGEVVHIDACEYPGVLLTDFSFIRGQWKNKDECGSTFLLAKACHDIDLVCWLNNSTKPLYVSSFGGRRFIVPEKAPEGAADNCFECKHSETCIYSVGYNSVRIKTIWGILPEGGAEEELRNLKNNKEKSRCAYKTNANIVDNQAVMIEFENGSMATFRLLSSGMPEVRNLFVKGTNGEIEGCLQKNKLVLRKYIVKTGEHEEIEYDLTDENVFKAHHGGDEDLITDFNAYMRNEESSFSTPVIDDTIAGYLCVYATDKAMENKEIVKINMD
ncbi:MAG: Gfo/Idh/MocA family oxidoreductase [Clostridiaceae bacterium]|nr:Gfo/Idh/MocA family oxidoreductase [Clostridiaceae bacterium]